MFPVFFVIFAITVVITYIAALSSLSSRIGRPAFTAKHNKTIKYIKGLIGKTGAICIILTIIGGILLIMQLPQTSPGLLLICLTVADVIAYLYMLILWSAGPTEEYATQTKQLETKLDTLSTELNNFLSKYYIDKKFQIDAMGLTIGICQGQKQLLLYKAATATDLNQTYKTIPFRSIVDCELTEDNVTVMKGGLGRAAVGAVVAGEAGAIIGAATRSSSNMVNTISIRIITNDILNPYHPIIILDRPIERKGIEYAKKYQLAQEIYSTIVAIIHSK